MGKLFVVGLGPGAAEFRTAQAQAALEAADVILGYSAYLDLLRNEFTSKTLKASGMRQEMERCHEALRQAQAGACVALVCSGDPGVYGMASPVGELAEAYPEVDIEVVPGITAALYGASRLGAPLGHDFCLVSLSDLLTPWEVVEQRLRAAVQGDFGLVLYNPASRHRPDHLRRACDVLLEAGRRPDAACGFVKNGAREDEICVCLSLAELRETTVDMFTVVFIGSSQTVFKTGKMVTPRGYERP